MNRPGGGAGDGACAMPWKIEGCVSTSSPESDSESADDRAAAGAKVAALGLSIGDPVGEGEVVEGGDISATTFRRVRSMCTRGFEYGFDALASARKISFRTPESSSTLTSQGLTHRMKPS